MLKIKDNVLKIIFCKLLKKHRYTNELNCSLIAEGCDEFYRCKYCGKIKSKYMWEK